MAYSKQTWTNDSSKLNATRMGYIESGIEATAIVADAAIAPGAGEIVNADVNASAAISYSKLNLATSIVNADIGASAAIAASKLGSNAAASGKYLDGNNSWTTLPTSGPTVTYATTPPGSPANGDIWYCVDATTNSTFSWAFRYNSANSTYKWEFIGGSPGLAETTTSETTNSASYTNLSGGATGPSFTVPRAGDYMIETGFNSDTSAGIIQTMSYDIGGTGAVDADYVRAGLDTTTSNRSSVSRIHKQSALAASTALVAKYKVSSSTGTFTNRFIRVTPIRVS